MSASECCFRTSIALIKPAVERKERPPDVTEAEVRQTRAVDSWAGHLAITDTVNLSADAFSPFLLKHLSKGPAADGPVTSTIAWDISVKSARKCTALLRMMYLKSVGLRPWLWSQRRSQAGGFFQNDSEDSEKECGVCRDDSSQGRSVV